MMTSRNLFPVLMASSASLVLIATSAFVLVGLQASIGA